MLRAGAGLGWMFLAPNVTLNMLSITALVHLEGNFENTNMCSLVPSCNILWGLSLYVTTWSACVNC